MNIAVFAILAVLVPIILALLIPIVAIIGGVTLLSKGASKRETAQQTAAEEAALVRDIQAGLDRMAERVEALETLMVEERASRQTRPRV
jgi:phage shock protein B